MEIKKIDSDKFLELLTEEVHKMDKFTHVALEDLPAAEIASTQVLFLLGKVVNLESAVQQLTQKINELEGN